MSTPTTINQERHADFVVNAERCSVAGAALFLALAFLSLFSMLGATYVRYMSLELEANARHLHGLRARHYATGGIHSALGQMQEALRQGNVPNAAYTFTFGFYGRSDDSKGDTPVPLDLYAAQAVVSVEPMGPEAWTARFGNETEWPGAGQAYHLVSQSEVVRARTGRMRVIGKHAIACVVVSGAEDYQILAWGTHRE